MSTSWPWRTALINNFCSTTRQLLIGISTPSVSQSRTRMFSGADAARLSRRKFHRISTAVGSHSSYRVKTLTVTREPRTISPIQLPQEGNGKTLSIDRLTKRHRQGDCAAFQLFRKIFARLIHVDPDTGDSQMRCFLLRSHLYQDTSDLASVNLHVVWRFNRRCERKFVLDCARNGLGRPGSKLW